MSMIALFTDFGLNGPYVGQMQAVVYHHAPATAVVNLFADAPVFNPRAAAYLLAAFRAYMPPDTVFLCVVDPGVGTAARIPVALCADGTWFVGPDNGLFQIVRQRATQYRQMEIVWRPPRLSDSFHGRDLFAPIAAWIASGASLDGKLAPAQSAAATERWPDDLAAIIYIDHYGNAVTGLRGTALDVGQVLLARGRKWKYARTFGEVTAGECFWYVNANGLVELAINHGSAAHTTGIQVGDDVDWEGKG